MTELCKDSFWNSTLSWNTDHPDFSNCFEQIALICVPCGFLWLCFPWQIYSVISGGSRLGRFTKMTIAKLTLCIVLVILELVDLGFAAQILIQVGGDAVPTVNLISPLIQAATFLVAMVYIDFDRRKGKPSNAILFTFWLLLTIAGVIILRSKVLRSLGFEKRNPDDIFGLFTYELYFPVVVTQLFMSTFADDYPERFENWTKNPSPETNASFLNCVFGHWITELLRIGWQRHLRKEDIWDLLHEEKSEVLEADLQRHWEKQCEASNIGLNDFDSTHSVNSRISRGNEGGSHRRSYGTLPRPPPTPIPSKKKPSLIFALYHTFWAIFWESALVKVGYDALLIITPIVVGEIIEFVAKKEIFAWRGYVYAIILFACAFVHSLCFGGLNYVTTRMGMQVRSALSGMIYRKAINLSNMSKRNFPVGDVTNMMTADIQRISDFLYYHHFVWITPITVCLLLYVLWQYVGIASLSGFFTVVFVIFINFVFVARAKGFEVSAVKQKDVRLRSVNEVFNGIKILKMYAWEPVFEEKIAKSREGELTALKKSGYLVSLNHCFMLVTAPLGALATYATYVYMDSEAVLTPQTAIVTLLFLFNLRHSLTLIPVGATLMVQSKIATGRMEKFFACRELDPLSVEKVPQIDGYNQAVLSVVGGNFSWSHRLSTSQVLALKNINLEVKKNQLVGVCGAVGCGKTSFINALLGLMEKVSGHVTVRGSVAYVTQQAWIQNLTLRDNILFGKPYEEDKYQKVLEACALIPDLEILTAGDQTEIGEKGINLSGGQKLRISLARAVYFDADIYFLDDPLSAVDAHVGKHIFDKVIGPTGLLQNKTRIFVTNAIHWLPKCDFTVYLEQGRISEMGTYDDLVERDERFGDFLRQCDVEQQSEVESIEGAVVEKKKPLDREHELELLKQATLKPSETEGNISQSMEVRPVEVRPLAKKLMEKLKAGGEAVKLINVEDFKTGGVKWIAYWHLCKEMTLPMSALILFGYFFANAFFMSANMWVALWSQTNMTLPDGRVDQSLKGFYVGIYGTLTLCQLIIGFLGLFGIAYGLVLAGRSLHHEMLSRLMRSPMWFFDTTPLGRIVNRFGKDIDAVDVAIPTLLRFVLNSFFMSLVFILLILVVFPLLTALVIPLAAVAYFVKGYYMSTTSQLKRLDVLSRSPLISSLQESASGSNIISAMEQSERFISENHKKIDHLTSVIHCSNAALRWMTLVLMFLANTLTLFAAVFAVFGRDYLNYEEKPAFVGLGLMAAIAFTQLFPWCMQNLCDLEGAMMSIERLREYSKAPVEAPAIIANYRPPAKWPYFGNLTFTDYQTRYRDGMDLVLKGVTLTISSGEKIGIVGRTGSGKSTLTLALLRIIEPAGGGIYLDGTDISRIGLHDLRSRITIIPQDSVLFSGSLRMNLDPFGQYSDEQIWKALELSRLKPYFQASRNGLEFNVSEGGINLSVGQRQLICLARALLRRSKVLVLDEATAAIDFETDKFVQEVIRAEFADCTILTVAHRIHTIMDSTKVLVMDAGKVSEFDTPENLLKTPDSLFYKLAKDAGEI